MRFGKLKALLLAAAAYAAIGSSAAVAATINLGTVSSNSPFSNSVVGTGTTFTDTFNFTINTPASVGASATNVSLQIGSSTFNQIFGFAGKIDSANLTLSVSSFVPPGSPFTVFTQVLSGFANLASGPHTLTITGVVPLGMTASYGGNLTVASVPVPPALWLMGTALLALASLRRRRTLMA